MLAHGPDGRWNIGVGVAQKIPGLALASWRSEQRPALIVATVQQDGQKQAKIDVAGVQQRRPRGRPEPLAAIESLTLGRGSTSPLALRRCIGSNWLGVVERMWLISL